MKYGIYRDKDGILVRYGSCPAKAINKQPYDLETETMIVLPKTAKPYDPRAYHMNTKSDAIGFRKLVENNAPE